MGPPTRCARKKPRRREEKETNNTRYQTRNALTKQLSLASAIAALYAVLVAILPATSVPIVQVRIADVLMPLAILFGWPAIVGVTIGAGLGNLVADTLFGLPAASVGVDIVGGSVANLVAATLAWKIAQKNWEIRGRRVAWLLAVNAETVVIGLIVGTYLGWLFSIPLWISVALIIAGSFVAISIGGYTVVRILGRAKSLDALRSTGLLARGT